ncbi:MAG: protein-arginine deiminase family protein, partial [Nannocystaceae bacterium]
MGRKRWVLACVLAVGCGGDDGGNNMSTAGSETGSDGTTTDGSESSPSSDGTGSETGSDAGTDSESESDTSGEPGVDWSFADIRGVANDDDDNSEGRRDWLEPPFDADNDLEPLTLPALPEGDQVRLTIAGDTNHIRLWRGGAGAPFLGANSDAAGFEVTFTPDAGESLWVEFGEYNARGTLKLERLDAASEVLDSAEIVLHGAPLILNHHLQPAEHIWVVDLTGGCGAANGPFLAAYDALGDRVTGVPGTSYDCDRWIQDEIEFATGHDGGGARQDVTIDSIRDRGLDDVPEDLFFSADNAYNTWGKGPKTSFDSFGNLEISPPVTVDGVEYPFGRVYFGRDAQEGIDAEFADFLISQEIQAPFEVDSTWLCVGHVDEWMSWVPDKTAPRGFRFLYSDVDMAYALLEGLDQNLPLPRFGADHGYPTVGSIVDDNALRAYNEDIRDDYLLPMRARMKSELGLSEEEIIGVPSIFEELGGGCSGLGLALIPGMVNLIVANFGDGDSHLMVPDPFLRTSDNDQGADPLIAAFTAAMPGEHQLH